MSPKSIAVLDCVVSAERARQLAGGEVQVIDTLRQQLAELVATRAPGRRLSAEQVAEGVAALLGERGAEGYGTWAYYPWRHELVHVLPHDQLRELRTDRNRNKITRREQARLLALRVGVVGLSVGQSIALTLAQEGVGGFFRLADHDTLSLSNLNRLRGSIAQLGLKKTDMAARAMAELDPYLALELFSDGVGDDNIDAFLDGLDVVVEECDAIDAKLLVRHAARERGIPVVMANSEGGLIDVERFDREPDRPLFHGLVAEVDHREFRAADMDTKVAFLLPVVGLDNVSDRMVASLVEIDHSLSSWPQLASSVALGAAVVTNVVRRIALGELNISGRFVVDVDRLISDAAPPPLARAQTPPAPAAAPLLPPPPPAVEVVRGAAAPTAEQARVLVAYGVLAPSGGNAQPWRFAYDDGCLTCTRDAHAPLPAFDPDGDSVTLSAGAVAENVCLAARAMGFAAALSTGDGALWRLRFSPATPQREPLFDWIAARGTNRKASSDRPLEDASARALRLAADVTLLTERAAVAEVAELVAEADRIRLLTEPMLHDLEAELRWTRDEVERTRDGIDVDSLELKAGERASLRLLLRAPALRLVAAEGGGQRFRTTAIARFGRAPALAVLTLPGRSRLLDGGRALERFWLTAAAHGLALEPATTLLFLFGLVARHGGGCLRRSDAATVTRLRRRFDAVVGTAGEPFFLCRLGYADPPSARSLRRRVPLC
jgi:molybdopterin/thiamine biosynthesis adenylyltransferase/nitroreductase